MTLLGTGPLAARRVLAAASVALAAFAVAPALARGATPVGCDLDVVVPWGPEDPIQLADHGYAEDGSVVVFASARGHDGPSDGNDEIFAYDTATQTLEQLTDTENGAASNASAMLAGGASVVFYERHLAGGDTEIRVQDLTTGEDDLVVSADQTTVDLVATAADEPTALVARVGPGGSFGRLLLERYRPDGVLSPVDARPVAFDLASTLTFGNLSDDGEVAFLIMLDSWFSTDVFLRGFVLEGSTLTGQHFAEDGALVGDEARLLFTDGPRFTSGFELRGQTEVYQRSPAASGAPEQVAGAADLVEAGGDAEQLLVLRTTTTPFPVAPLPPGFGQPERLTPETGRRVPLHGRIGSEVVPVVGEGDGSMSTFALTTGNRLVLAACGSFADVRPSQAFADDIEWTFAEGISGGFDDGTYRPTTTVSRQAMAAFLHRLSGDPDPAAPTDAAFVDVGLGHPFLLDITWAVQAGITTGYEDGTFRPSAPVTRQAMSAFLHRLAGDEPLDPTPTTPTFTDVSPTHPFFADVEWAAANDISTGYQPGPTYRPADPVTRQAMAAFLHRTAAVLS